MWINREISNKIIESAASFPAVLLTGARQVGKTSLLQRLFPKHSFVTLDLPSNAELADKDPTTFLSKYPPPLVIDEVQYAPSLFRHLKILIDKDRKNAGKFILTGSQKFNLMKGIADSLAGRCAVIELETLSKKEISLAKKIPLLEVIIRGGFPELSANENINREVFYQSYLATYLERDVRSLLNIGQLRDFERFIRAAAIRSGQMLNKSEMGRDVGISATTANEWISVLQASNQLALLEPWFNNKTKTLSKSPKIYLADSGFLCFLLGINKADDLLNSPLAGHVWETFVFAELRKSQIKETGSWNMWVWKDNRGPEVDFLIHKGGRFDLMEAKFTEHPSGRDAINITRVSEQLGQSKISSKSIIARVEESYPLSDGLRAVSIDDI